jgi:NRAMP (natural resistance-associated macrophage protein)-like metal ion transporter
MPDKSPLRWLRLFGPGVITGASDDDPSGIATYSQAGAQFGFGLLWTMFLTYPLMAAIQEICARIGRVTGLGLAANLRRAYPKAALYLCVALLVIANTINIGADIGAIGSASELLWGGSRLAYAAAFTTVTLGLQIWLPYGRYARLLFWLSASLLAYVASAAVVHVDWSAALYATVVPSLRGDAEWLTMIVALFGTTISPYLFFWQASTEVEEEEADPKAEPLLRAPRQARFQLFRLRVDTLVGMGVSNVIAWFIIVTTASTLFRSQIHDVASAAQAAAALAPIAGRFAGLVFAAGIVGTGLLAVPVLAGSAGYAVAESFDCPAGLTRKPRDARVFYGVIVASTLAGFALNFTRLNPMKALIYAAVINGVAAVPIMAMTMLLATNRALMGEFVVPGVVRWLGWAATIVMFAAAVAMFTTLAKG